MVYVVILVVLTLLSLVCVDVYESMKPSSHKVISPAKREQMLNEMVGKSTKECRVILDRYLCS